MKFSDFKVIDPELADRLLEAERYNAQVADWQQTVRDQMQIRLEQLGKAEPVLVYQDSCCRAYRSLVDQAALFDDPILNPLVADLRDTSLHKPSNVVLDEILIKHGLTVGIGIDDYENIEDTFEFFEVAV
jgi:hypothetical protein